MTHETLSVFLPKSKYFRFNPRTENFPLDEIRPERLQRMKRIARSDSATGPGMDDVDAGAESCGSIEALLAAAGGGAAAPLDSYLS